MAHSVQTSATDLMWSPIKTRYLRWRHDSPNLWTVPSQQISGSIGIVNEGARATGDGANKVLGAATGLSDRARSLDTAMRDFLAAVMAA